MSKSLFRIRRELLPWPKPPGGPHFAACHFCDTLHEAEPLPEGPAARCSCCGAVLYQNRPASLARVTAFSIAALILMVVVNRFPFLTMDAAGLRTTLDLVSAARALIAQGSPILGIALALFTMVTPLALASGLIYVCAPLMVGENRAGRDACGQMAEPGGAVEHDRGLPAGRAGQPVETRQTRGGPLRHRFLGVRRGDGVHGGGDFGNRPRRTVGSPGGGGQ